MWCSLFTAHALVGSTSNVTREWRNVTSSSGSGGNGTLGIEITAPVAEKDAITLLPMGTTSILNANVSIGNSSSDEAPDDPRMPEFPSAESSEPAVTAADDISSSSTVADAAAPAAETPEFVDVAINDVSDDSSIGPQPTPSNSSATDSPTEGEAAAIFLLSQPSDVGVEGAAVGMEEGEDGDLPQVEERAAEGQGSSGEPQWPSTLPAQAEMNATSRAEEGQRRRARPAVHEDAAIELGETKLFDRLHALLPTLDPPFDDGRPPSRFRRLLGERGGAGIRGLCVLGGRLL